MEVRVPDPEHDARPRVEQVPRAEQIADAAEDEQRRHQRRQVDGGPLLDAEPADARELVGGARLRRQASPLLRRYLGTWRRPLPHLDAADREVGGDRHDQGDDQRGEEEPVGVLPRRQPEHVERQVVVEDRVAEAERHAVQRAREDQPRPRRRTGGDERAEQRRDKPDAPHPAQRRLVHGLDDVDALDRAVLRRQPAGDHEVAVDDGEEHGAEADGGDGADDQAPPEDRAQADLAEPEPVHVEVREDDGQHDEDDRDGRRDGQAPPDRVAPAARYLALVGRVSARGRTHEHPAECGDAGLAG